MRTRWVSLALLVAVGAAGCGSRASDTPAVVPSPTRTVEVGSPGYLLMMADGLRVTPEGADEHEAAAREAAEGCNGTVTQVVDQTIQVRDMFVKRGVRMTTLELMRDVALRANPFTTCIRAYMGYAIGGVPVSGKWMPRSSTS